MTGCRSTSRESKREGLKKKKKRQEMKHPLDGMPKTGGCTGGEKTVEAGNDFVLGEAQEAKKGDDQMQLSKLNRKKKYPSAMQNRGGILQTNGT